MTQKNIIKISSILLLVMITTVGATFAYYLIVVSGNNNTQANSKKYEIIYHGGSHISGDMQAVARKEDGKATTVEIGLASGSALANASLFIEIENISTNLAIAGFNWAVYRINGSNEVYVNSGNFSGKRTGNEIPIVTDYPLTDAQNETLTQFKVYFWIDGNNTDNTIEGGTFEGYIAARTDVLTGGVKTG